jgi:molybdenum cofactor cytidylyltransferase
MRARRLTPGEVARIEPSLLIGAVLVAAASLPGRRLAKGTRLDSVTAHAIASAAGSGQLASDLRLVWPDAEDMHEDEAAERLALAIGGAGVDLRPPRQSLLQLVSKWNGVLHVRHAALATLNQIESLEVFTLFHGQCVEEGDIVAAVKVVPHVVAAETVRRGVRLAREEGPLVEVRPYLPLHVAAIVCEPLATGARERFEMVADAKLSALGTSFAGVIDTWDPDPAVATERIGLTLRALAEEARHQVMLVAGVSAGDPLSPFVDALSALGGHFVRRGLPAHPGSMLWIAQLGQVRFLGLPGCGMFSMATAADLVLPRLLTGEQLDATSLAELAHGGVLGRDMRFRMPKYARDLDTPDGTTPPSIDEPAG